MVLYCAKNKSIPENKMIKKQSKEALCPHCEADLFEVIEISKSVKLEFNFCPNCGKEIEI